MNVRSRCSIKKLANGILFRRKETRFRIFKITFPYSVRGEYVLKTNRVSDYKLLLGDKKFFDTLRFQRAVILGVYESGSNSESFKLTPTAEQFVANRGSSIVERIQR